ncbi:hypothetical protein NSE01_23980 [Novosphingobium sediminis]|uniref:MPN domain-containing protein n=1 Tax=Novosphingobium sediminis TaxID=707214 RepID=A0A512ALK5_9SPHN|nr:hypothetical protein [Novosphingobium sediminis]GEO00566.1 hypothetical protein NSE01_23980 [Novosphingobium sediminis]
MSFVPFTTTERDSIEEVLAHQRAFKNGSGAVNSELHIALDGVGQTEVSRQIQPPAGGEMDAPMVAAANSIAGCRIIHNHPSEGSLSASDWNVLAHHSGMEMVAVNTQGTTFRGKVIEPDAFPNWFTKISEVEEVVGTRWEAQVTEWYNQGCFDLGDFANGCGWRVTLAIAERLRAKGHVAFEATLAGADAQDALDPRTKAIDQFLAVECAQQLP